MPVIDAHHHLWDAAAAQTPGWRDRHPTMRRPFEADDLRRLMAAEGVDESVLVQSDNRWSDTLFGLSVAEREDFIGGVVGWLPLEDPDGTRACLAEVRGRALVGVRHLVNFESDRDWLSRAGVEESLRVLADDGLAFDLVPTDERHFRYALGLAERVPNLRIVVDHLGNPPAPGGGWQPWADLMAELATSEQVFVKLSVGMSVLSEIATLDDVDLGRYVDHILEHFGPQRVLWASNWPVLTLAADYGTALARLRAAVAQLDADEQAWVFGRSAQRAYRLARHGRGRDDGLQDATIDRRGHDLDRQPRGRAW